MKKVLVVMAVMLGVGCVSASALETSEDSVKTCCSQATQDKYTKIEISEIPEVVKTGVEKAYPDQTIKEASVAEKDGAKTYKLVITSKEGTESSVVFNEKGEEVK
ncbi:hypothetical protein [Parabacteroides sp. AM08-6]|uniref:hypothetical protein n=1 Tax=Parabacteroides sp. AM08-6 TaxID=2292053 RepID=UPI000EFF74BC|nr:hypothetical protein [Parabacteroides sp. AM08-6]RHJ78556.1 hypothetical protein DW103_14680 [Parabacteroides sp. AM08-6]